MGFLLQLLYFPIRLALLPFKLAHVAATFLTCIVPLLIVVAVAAAAVWFMFIR